MLPNGKSFANRVADKLYTQSQTKIYKLVVLSDDSKGCGTKLNTGDGAFLATEYYYTKNVTAFFGPVCADDIELTTKLTSAWNALQFNFWRDYRLDIDLSTLIQMSTMSAANLAANVARVLLQLDWKKIAVITCISCFEQSANTEERFGTIRRVLQDLNIEILSDIDIDPTELTPASLAQLLAKLKPTVRVIFPILGDSLNSYTEFLRGMKAQGMNSDEYAAILTIVRYAISDTELPWMIGGVVNASILSLFERTVVLVNNYYSPRTLQRLSDEFSLGTSGATLIKYAQLYESMFTYAYFIETATRLSGNIQIYKNATYVRNLLLNQQIDGPFGKIALDSNSQRLEPFKIFIVNAQTANLTEFMKITISFSCSGESDSTAVVEGRCLYLTGDLLEKARDLLNYIPPDTPSCGYSGELCDQRGTIIVVLSIMVSICAGFFVFVCVRKVRTRESSSMPWAISATAIKFVGMEYTGTSNLSIHSLHSHQETKTSEPLPLDALNKPVAGRIRQIAMLEQGFVIIEPYKLKGNIIFDKNDMHWLFQMKQAVHDNINSFVGVSIDRNVDFYVIWKHCLRGTLSDVIKNSGIGNNPKFDRDFKGAFVRDLIKGLDYIHASSIGYHGGLTSTQCLIDGHWILKISGFGISKMFFKWHHNRMLDGCDGNQVIPNSELHYYAPEVRRAIKYSLQTNKPENLVFSNKEGQAHDMYSFGAVLFEIVYLKKVVEIQDCIDESMQGEDETGIFSEDAEDQIPESPTFPDEPEIHPDLISLIRKCFNSQTDLRPDANMARKITDATLKISGSLVDQMIKNTENYTMNLENLVSERTSQLEIEQRRSDELLKELLPRSVINELKLGRTVAPKHYKSVTIMYSDIVGFTSLCSESQPLEVVTLLNGMFTAFDNIISEHNAYKVETIGDAYLVASGVPEKIRSDHVKEIASTALKQREFLFGYEIPHRPGQRLHCRWGFNSGSVFTGVVGVTAPRYCVFGSTVTLAAKMENSGNPDKIQMTLKSHQLLSARFPEFKCSPRGGVKLEGVGTLLTYWLDGRDDALASARSVQLLQTGEEDSGSAG